MHTKYHGDLELCDAPDDIPVELRYAAEKAREAATELESAWQDKSAGRPWEIIAKELDRCAERIEKALRA